MLLRLHFLLIVATPALLVSPPAEGPMLVLPLWPGDEAGTVNWVRSSGASLVGRGPYRGSLVVVGSRSALAPAAIANGALLAAASSYACSPLEGVRA